MAELAVAIDQSTSPILLSSAITPGSLPAPYTLDAENILVNGGSGTAYVSVDRGVNGTAPAGHAKGTVLVSGWGGGSGAVDSVNGQTGVVMLGLADVLAVGNDPGGIAIQADVGGSVIINGGPDSFGNLNGSTLVLPAADSGGTVILQGINGAAGQAGGVAFIQGGTGDGGATYGAYVDARGGEIGAPGKLEIGTGGTGSFAAIGEVGQFLGADGYGFGAWQTPLIRIAAGVPSGAPGVAELPIAVDSTAVTGGIYAWDGANWIKAASI